MGSAYRETVVSLLGMRRNAAFCATNAIGSMVSDNGPRRTWNPPSAASVTPRPAQTAPSLWPYGNAVFITELRPGRIGTTAGLSHDLNAYRPAHGCPESGGARRASSAGENGRSDHGCSGTTPRNWSRRR